MNYKNNFQSGREKRYFTKRSTRAWLSFWNLELQEAATFSRASDLLMTGYVRKREKMTYTCQGHSCRILSEQESRTIRKKRIYIYIYIYTKIWLKKQRKELRKFEFWFEVRACSWSALLKSKIARFHILGISKGGPLHAPIVVYFIFISLGLSSLSLHVFWLFGGASIVPYYTFCPMAKPVLFFFLSYRISLYITNNWNFSTSFAWLSVGENVIIKMH